MVRILGTSLEDFKNDIQYGKPLLGLDIGKKTLGLALSDTNLVIATPLKTIHRIKFAKDAETLIEIIKKEKVTGLVVGLPLNLDGSEGKACQTIKQFVRNLLKIIEIPVFFQDERFSTVVVTEALEEAKMSYKKQKKNVDKMAASYILQQVLDKNND